MTTCPEAIKRLIDRFDQQSDQVRSPDYNETSIRIDFINPLMRELGWDIDNHQGFAEQYREVVHEDRVKVAGQTKAPDYSFRVGGQRKFFLEAKKPSVDIRNHWEPAYQLRRYAWSAKLACSLLTDFEELAIYDGRIRPRQFDKATTARRDFICYTDYPERWEFLHGTFSKEAVLKGDFDRYCDSKKGRGAELFDDAFLGEIEEWRTSLATTLARRNEALDEASLNFAVQRIIDRIIFLRIAEDRGTESVGQLQALLNGDATYERLGELFRRADERYNSGLFHFHKEQDRDEAPDTLTPSLVVDDKTLKGIIRALYYPASPYEFTMVSADILGSVYERFLGKVITLTAGHNARIEEKPEVRKAGGVYYTPTYIVDYIVKNTVGKLLEGKSPKEAGKLKVLDPACGSGSFLIGAYQFLLDWYLAQYTAPASDPASLATGKKPLLRPTPTGGYALTINERKRILLDHIHGVDLDNQAVEVTKLNLLLKCLEGETAQTLGFQQRLFRERALPDLGKNILCGNSLIGTDIIGTEAWSQMSEEERQRINPLDYDRAFPQVFKGKDKGFDAVIGNPPWGADLGDESRIYLARYADVADFESSQYFLHKLATWCAKNALTGMIIPNTFLVNVWAHRSRKKLLANGSFSGLVDLSDLDVFLGPNVRSAICFWTPMKESFAVCQVWTDVKATPSVLRNVGWDTLTASETWKNFFEPDSPARSLVLKLSAALPTLDQVAVVRQGYIPYRTTTLTRRHGAKKAGQIVSNREFHSNSQLDATYLPELQGGDVGRYTLSWSGVWVKYGEWVSTYLPVDEVFSGPRVLIREITGKLPHRLYATVTADVYVHNPSVLAVIPNKHVSPALIAGVLNSKIASLMFAVLAPKAKKGLFPKIIITDAKRLPFPELVNEKLADRITALVSTMLFLQKRLSAEKLPQRREQIQREIDATDRQIDQLVYQLYGLTDDEIRIVEEATAQVSETSGALLPAKLPRAILARHK